METKPLPNLANLLSKLTIQTKSATTERFPIYSEFAWAQRKFLSEIERQYNQGKPVRIIVLKARQLGISTAMEGVLFWWAFIHPGVHGLVITHENQASEDLFNKTKMYWEQWPFKDLYHVRSATRRALSWDVINSSIRVATAKNERTGRGATLHSVHASECAFYDFPEDLFTGLNQTVPRRHKTIVVLESTANGLGNWFHNQWYQAEEQETDYIPLFFPWYNHYEYKIDTTLSTKLELDAEERELLRLGADYESIAWRRWAIPNLTNNDLDKFYQEYPATPEEAFISSGANIFPLQHLNLIYEGIKGARGSLIRTADEIKFISDPHGCLTIFKRPVAEARTDRYFVAGDPSESISGDPACIQVLNRQTMEQVAVWHGRVDPITFADEMINLGYYYNSAQLCPEVEGGGQATIATILNRSYPNVWLHRWADKAPGKTSIAYGWSTTWQRKRWAIGTLKAMISETSIMIHDLKTLHQLRNYVSFENGEMGNNDQKSHDDAVMALAICVTASNSEGPFIEYTRKQDPVMDLFEQEAV